MLDYQNSDHSALSSDQAVGKVIDGSSAFNMMGDWAHGEFVKAGARDGEDFGWVSHPGTDDIFIIVTDAFPIAKGARTPPKPGTGSRPSAPPRFSSPSP
jgi:glucose/mannose transport system substrate-binding protein